MHDKQSTYSKQTIDIADILFSNPTKDVSVIVSEIVSKSHKCDRTVWRWIKKAQEYNKSRIEKQEKIKDELLSEETKKAIKSAILSRNEALSILSNIANGKARKIERELIIPSDTDRTRAIQQLAKMEGWNAPVENINTIASLPTTINIIRDDSKR